MILRGRGLGMPSNHLGDVLRRLGVDARHLDEAFVSRHLLQDSAVAKHPLQATRERNR